MNTNIKRLTLIKTSIELMDYELIASQVTKLEAADVELLPIIMALKNKQFAPALMAINQYLKQQNDLTPYKDPEIGNLQRVFELLLLQLQDLSAQHLSMQDKLEDFNGQYYLNLGDTLGSILHLEHEILVLEITQLTQEEKQTLKQVIKAELETEIEAKLKQQQQNQKDKLSIEQEQHQALQQAQQTQTISKQDEKTLKGLYRQATKLCHPDAADKKFAKQANQVFARLSVAYKQKDLALVEQIYHELKGGSMNINQAITTIDDVEILARKISTIKVKIAHKQQQVQVMTQDEQYIEINNIDDLDAYWILKKSELKEAYQALLSVKEQFKADII